ncbi:MAG: Gfo/Idh/MocA family oxidoreductase [Acidobacteria bacterium]|nr:Gfo/Idh/MocA family oxidoreductase [Acidobacteriota bacterium]
MKLLTLAILPFLTFAADLRVGIIGLDTSHVVQFTQLLNDSSRSEHVPGARVVAAFKGGSPDVAASVNRIEKFTAEVTSKWGVELVDSIPELCRRVDAVLLLSVDGRKHLEQARPVLQAKKPIFIDKPMAGSLKDAREIVKLARASGTPLFSASSQRYSSEILALKANPKPGTILGAFTWGPAPIEPYLPDLFWYGIHSIEALYALMGPGCESVTRTHTPAIDLLVAKWKDGRIGTVRGIREGAKSYGAVVFGSQGNLTTPPAGAPAGEARSNYVNLVREIVRFFQSGVPPVKLDETLEVFAFMEAAEVSKSRHGAAVALQEVMR